jgi:hypothetical protein
MEIKSYREYTSKFEARVNFFIKGNHISRDHIISITNSRAYTTMWYWGLAD